MDPAVLLMLVVLLAVPAGWAALLRWARCPGWAVVGGLVGGVMLGPTLFGRIMPDHYEALLLGAAPQRQALQQLTGLHGADLIAARQAGADREQLANLKADHTQQYEQAERQWKDAQWAHQQPLRLFAFGIVALTLLGAGAAGVRRSASARNLVAPMSVGAWSAAVPGGLAFFAMRAWWDQGPAVSALVAAAVAMGPWALTTIDREAADQAEVGGAAMVQTAGRIATVIAIIAAGWALWSLHRWEGLVFASPILAAPLGWSLRTWKTGPGPLVRSILVPALTACVAVKIELYEDFAFWPIAVILLLGGDARWLGAFTGAMVLGGRRAMRTMRLVLGSMAAGPTQLAVAALAVHTWSIPPRFAMALLLGAVLIEVTTPTRRAMARRLIQTEEQVDAMRDEE